MFKTPLYVAWRYLFAKKSHNAINIVSAVSAAGVCVATAALICVLSVMNGFGTLVEDMFSQFDPELKILPAEGKSFKINTPQFEEVRHLSAVDLFTATVEETALVRFNNKQIPVHLKGVEDSFQQLTNIDSIITDGSFVLCDYYETGGVVTRAFERAVLGRGLANQIGIGAHFVSGMRIYAPKRNTNVNLMNPEKALNQESVFISGIFAVNQIQYDDSYMLVSLPLARNLFDFEEDECSAVELSVASGTSVKSAKRQIKAILGDDYKVLDRYEQQEDFFRILQIEKILTALLLAFILLIATFNIIGSLSMLMIDKKNDIKVFSDMGADSDTIRKIFLFEGWLISLLGAAIGLVVGVVLCILQQEFGLLKLGNGENYVISAYPVQVQVTDIIFVTIIVLAIGFIAAYIPTKQLKQQQK